MGLVPRLYYMPRTRSGRVLWLLAEIHAPCELVKLAPEQRQSPEHLARHRLGRVPALELDHRTVIFESAAICLQLADLHPQAGVIGPLGSPQRALVYQWVLFAMTELEAPLYRWIREAAENSTDSPTRERFAQAAAALETALDGRDWLLGDRFTVADVLCTSVLGGAHSQGLADAIAGLAGLRRARPVAARLHRGRCDLEPTSTLAPTPTPRNRPRPARPQSSAGPTFVAFRSSRAPRPRRLSLGDSTSEAAQPFVAAVRSQADVRPAEHLAIEGGARASVAPCLSPRAGLAQRRAQSPICIGNGGLVRLRLPAPERRHGARRALLLDA